MQIDDVNPGGVFEGTVLVQKVRRPGPIVLSVFDGARTMDAVTRDHEFSQGDVIEMKARLGSRNGSPQLDIIEASLSDVSADEMIDALAGTAGCEPVAQALVPMKQVFADCARRIRKAVFMGQDINMHFHADADGISSVLAMDKAAKDLASQVRSSSRISRHPSRSPYLENTDLLRDISGDSLVILLDCGSGSENRFAVSLLRSRGLDVIIIDHHRPDESLSPTVHVNPFLHGLDQRFTAGMLSYEIARLVNAGFDDILLPAISSVGDKSDIDDYREKAGDHDLVGLASSMDFFAYFLRFDPGFNVYDILFDDESRRIVVDEVERLTRRQLSYVEPVLKVEDAAGFKLIHFDLSHAKLEYPRPGKLCGIVFERYLEGKGIVIGHFPDMLIMRVRDPVMSFPELLEHLRSKFPASMIEGGGHDCAASISFSGIGPKQVTEEIRRILES